MIGHTPDLFELFCRADKAMDAGRKREGFRLFKRGALAGDRNFYLNLGYCFFNGLGTKKDSVEAMRWYKRALKSGDTNAAYNIAIGYRNTGNSRYAFQWFRRAVDASDGDACVQLGLCHLENEGTKRDPKRAVECFRKAIKSDPYHITQWSREDAMFRLGIAYRDGLGVKHSGRLAKYWLQKANIDGDHKDAAAALRGFEVAGNEKRAGKIVA